MIEVFEVQRDGNASISRVKGICQTTGMEVTFAADWRSAEDLEAALEYAKGANLVLPVVDYPPDWAILAVNEP